MLVIPLHALKTFMQSNGAFAICALLKLSRAPASIRTINLSMALTRLASSDLLSLPSPLPDPSGHAENH